jgi:hypothetical protein
VSLTDIEVRNLELSDDYDILWKSLRDLPALQGKEFPERSERAAWYATQTNFAQGPHSVVLSGSLRFNETNPTGPFFRLQLQPMKLDLSHRLGRRFGHDRFLELDMPHLAGRFIPKILKELGDPGREMIIEHLVDGTHRLFGRTWKPFHCKPKDSKVRKRDILKDFNEEDSAATAHRVFFFAVDGDGFTIVKDPLRDPSDPESHARIDIPTFLNMVRPTRKNTHQSYLKLFSRTSLALSRNIATVVLEQKQIHYKKDILCGSEVMTDGAGRMSYSLALRVAQKLGLTYLPCGFQGRLGEAKGFWSIDHRDRGAKDWIEVYDSQRKWERSTKRGGESDDPSHRTFEVNRPSGPLKSANLNLQLLPLLMDRAKDRPAMRKAISQLLERGLNEALETLQAGMNDGPSLRQWTRDANSNMKERLKAGVVPFRAGLPVNTEERLNMMLDAGFEPRSLHFVKEMTRALFKGKCDELKQRLNIRVGKSAYVYMIPDFWGVLAPDEVYIDFSSFVDDVSGFTGVSLNGDDVLVARSPAHFVSDIQKVKAVVKAELMGLKDVIVFPIKGNPSLAAKLSGGDYDGDLAWVCWEPSIVENFETADVPEMPDLVAEGYITKDSTKYADLVKGQKNPVSFFLKKAFSFNMQQSMLGICTAFKEAACYTVKSVSSREAVYMSTLLSSLVDQAKQGYSFDDDAFTRFKEDCIKIVPRKPLYKTDHLDSKADHIVDYLMFLAHKTIQAALQKFHESPPLAPPFWDDDLAGYYNWAKRKAATYVEWKKLLDDLDKDVNAVKEDWTNHFKRDPNDESMPTFTPFLLECFERFQAIRPREDTPLTQSLLPDFGHPDVAPWAYLRASAAFASYSRRYVSNFVFWMAGKQLAQLKANCVRGNAPHAIVPSMYVIYKPDNTFIQRSKLERGGMALLSDGTAGISGVEELDEVEDDE